MSRFYVDSILLQRNEDDWEDAFRRALNEGLKKQQEYENADGNRVVWKLASIVSLDRIGETLGDSQEVYSERVSAPDPIPNQRPIIGRLLACQC
jgi:hypothetical protein